MKRIALTASLMAVLFAGCTPNEDLVKGSLPPKTGTNIVSVDHDKVIVIFKGRIDGDTCYLSLDENHIWVNRIDKETQEGDTLSGESVFVGPPDFPFLTQTNEQDDTLILEFKPTFQLSDDYDYVINIDNHQLWCTDNGGDPCPDRNHKFSVLLEPYDPGPDVYDSPYDAADDPPYVELVS